MEGDRPKTVKELFDGTHRDTAECWNRESVYHEWWVFNAREESQWALQEAGRFLFVFCRACGGGIVKSCGSACMIRRQLA